MKFLGKRSLSLVAFLLIAGCATSLPKVEPEKLPPVPAEFKENWTIAAPAEAQPALHPDRMRLLARQFADEPAYRHVGLCLEDLARGRCQASARIDRRNSCSGLPSSSVPRSSACQAASGLHHSGRLAITPPGQGG